MYRATTAVALFFISLPFRILQLCQNFVSLLVD